MSFEFRAIFVTDNSGVFIEQNKCIFWRFWVIIGSKFLNSNITENSFLEKNNKNRTHFCDVVKESTFLKPTLSWSLMNGRRNFAVKLSTWCSTVLQEILFKFSFDKSICTRWQFKKWRHTLILLRGNTNWIKMVMFCVTRCPAEWDFLALKVYIDFEST